MKLILLSLIALILSLPLSAENITFEIHNIRNLKGEVHIYVFHSSSASSYPKDWDKALCHSQKSITNSKLLILTCELKPAGEYAAFAFHDENQNHILDHHWLKFPLEGYGFSGGAKGNFGPPSFEQAHFYFNDSSEVQKISLSYFLENKE